MIRLQTSLFAACVLCLSAATADDKPRPAAKAEDKDKVEDKTKNKAEADDPIAATLKTAKEDYQTAAEKAGEKLLAAFAGLQKKLEDDTKLKVDQQLKLVEQINEEKKAFEADSTKLPKSAGMKVAASDYHTKTAAAKKKCEAAFDKAAEAYRAKKDLAAAKAVLEEKGKFFLAVVEAAVLTKGMVWRGIKTWTKVGAVKLPGTKQEFSVRITEVSDGGFKGIVDMQWYNSVPIKGIIRGQAIEWKGDNARHEQYTGMIDGKTLKGECGNGTLLLMLTDKK